MATVTLCGKASCVLVCLLTHSVCTSCVFPATAPGATPVPAPGSGPARDPAALGPHPSLPARRLLQLRPALSLLHPGQLLPRSGPGGEGGQGPGGCRESAPRRGWGQVRLVQTQREGLEGGGGKKKKGKTVTVNEIDVSLAACLLSVDVEE